MDVHEAQLRDCILKNGVNVGDIEAIRSGKGALWARPLSDYSPVELKALDNLRSDADLNKWFDGIIKMVDKKIKLLA